MEAYPREAWERGNGGWKRSQRRGKREEPTAVVEVFWEASVGTKRHRKLRGMVATKQKEAKDRDRDTNGSGHGIQVKLLGQARLE
ncbi:peptidase [Sesbania bispinosa]|nr:peptidase [Sesbania bispinosa]